MITRHMTGTWTDSMLKCGFDHPVDANPWRMELSSPDCCMVSLDEVDPHVSLRKARARLEAQARSPKGLACVLVDKDRPGTIFSCILRGWKTDATREFLEGAPKAKPSALEAAMTQVEAQGRILWGWGPDAPLN